MPGGVWTDLGNGGPEMGGSGAAWEPRNSCRPRRPQGYYLVADSYIALYSRFSTCGAWQGHYILDFIEENTSQVRPDTVHADTQGQRTAIFGLAYLLGIQLMPRIRHWKDLTLFRPSSQHRYTHIDMLFREQVDWGLIRTLLPDMLRVALSVRAGKIMPSTILRRLATYSRKNKLYFAFRELGRVVRTIFLLQYVSSVQMRHVIQAATRKSVQQVCGPGQLRRSGAALPGHAGWAA
jgi:TnpA family transposase